jgi:iron-sulfur cluster repair protein YtfE (RIC family)
MVEVKTKFDTILEQHTELRDLTAKLREFLQQPRPEIGKPGSHTWASSLAATLTQYHDKIFRHFREEEQSGFLDELQEMHPHALHAIETLRQEHDRILADLRAIMAAALVYSEGKPLTSPRLRRWTLSLLDRIAHHEREETELFQEVHYHDLGIGD